MPIPAGTRLGPYEVVALIGAGGMGEVYRARDARLHRDVAIKVLPEGVARDREQRARFEREAQAVAALSHPNVVAIFDTGSHGDHLYAVTELLTGQTLRERLRPGPLPVGKAIDWAVQVARGLAAAHDRQLIHRDVKPENIFVTTDGHVKILDFGLARVAIAGKADTDTTSAVTGAGVVLGTVGYMAPEQVRGEPGDARADLFAFGAVLYEMLTGQRAFHRGTAAETMTAILREEPPALAAIRAELPPGLERTVGHCLEKNPHERFQSARDVAFALETLSAPSSAASGHGAGIPPTSAQPPITRIVIGATMAVAVIAGAWFVASRFGWVPSGSSPAPTIAVGAAKQVTADDGLEIDAALSPDGKLLAYVAGKATQMRIFIRPVAGGRILTLSEGGAAFEYQPRWSPDGSQILFLRRDGVFVASSLGGTARRVAGGAFAGAAWLPDGQRVLLVRSTGLSVTATAGGAEVTLVSAPELHSCAWSPANDWVACASGNSSAIVPGAGFGNVAPSTIVMVPAGGGPVVTVTDTTSVNLSPVWSPDGRSLYFVSNREGPRDIYVFDVQGSRGVQHPARRVTTGLGVQSIAFSMKGERLAYVTSVARANIWSLPVPTGGAVDTAGAQALTSTNQIVESIRVSADEKWLVYDSTLHGNADIFRISVQGGAPERLTTDPADDFCPDLSPDGRMLAYHSWRSGSRDVHVQSIESGAVEVLTATTGQESYPKWSPDGRALVFVDQQPRLFYGTLFIMRREAGGSWSAPVPIRSDVGTQGTWVRRPNGDQLVFATLRGIELIAPESGSPRVLYEQTPGSSDPFALSVVASADGRTLYFKSMDTDGRASIWSVPGDGGRPRLRVRFNDLSRPSIRPDFAMGAGRLFFTLEDRQADIWVAEVSKR